MENLSAAKKICNLIGLTDDQFYSSIVSFEGAGNRLEFVEQKNERCVIKDFAHSPSKLKATTASMKKQFPQRKLIACLELYTFSSLTKDFLIEYKNCMDESDIAIVYFNPDTIKNKQLESLTEKDIIDAFGRKDLKVISEVTQLESYLCKLDWKNQNLLMMSSGNFDSLNIKS